MMEQQFARFLLDRVDDKMKGIAGPEAGEIKLHLKELRGIVDTVLDGSKKGGRGASNG